MTIPAAETEDHGPTGTVRDCASDGPATLSGTDAGTGLYRRLGFEVVGNPLDWKPIDRG
jgi:hypothetical protein